MATWPSTCWMATAPGASAGSGSSSMRRNTRSAAAQADCSSLMMLATSLMGPENRREYSTKLDRLPMERFPHRNKMAPKMLTKAKDRLLIKFTEGPVMPP